MAEPSKGRQSKLRNMQRPPDSDRVVPETQLETSPESDYGGDYAGLSAEDLALMEKLFVKKPPGSTATPPQAPAVSLQTVTLIRPASAKTEEPKVFGRHGFFTAPPKKNEPTVKPRVQPENAIPSVEGARQGDFHQDDRTTPVPSSWVQMPTPGEPVTKTSPTLVEATQDTEKDRHKPEEPVPMEAAHAEPVQLEQPTGPIEPQIAVHSSMQGDPISNKKRSGTKGEKMKKRPLFRSFNQVPLQSCPLSILSAPQGIRTPVENDTAVEAKVGAARPQRSGEKLAVKSRPGETTLIDGPLEAGQATSAVPIDAAVVSPEADDHHIEPSNQDNGTGNAASSASPQADVRYVFGIPDVSTDRNDLSMPTSFETHGQDVQAQQHPVMEPPAHRGPFPIPAPVVARRHGRLKLRPLSNSLPTHLARSSTQHVPTNKENGNITLDNSGLSLQERAQQVLHGVSSRAGSARVAKSPKQARLPHDARSAFSAANAPQQSRARSTALDAALNALRTAYLGDQDRLEDQMAVKEKARESERSEYRATIKMQLETILEQRLKLAKSEEWLAKLEQKFNSTQKYVAGLQRDHEDMKKSMVTFQKQDKKTLQDQIAQVVKEKEDLQAGLEAMVESCEKSQRSMLKTMHEIQLRYVTALSREHDLKIRLNERMTMYEEEKHRKAELEQQLLPFIQAIQRQLSGSSATLIEKIGGLQASMGGQTTENSRDSTVKKCLLILQQLQSQPPLTSKDVRKAEDMLRYLYEKTDAGLEIITRGLNENPISIEDIRDCVRDQIQGLQAEILGNNQAIAEDNLAREVNQRLATDIDTEKQKNRQLEEQAASLQHSEATLKSRITSLEQEMGELRNSIEAQQAEPCESEQKIAELEVQLSTMTEDLRKSSAVVEGHERLYLEEELKFCKYRADALAHLANLKKYIWQITDDDKAKARECSALRQDVAELRAQLDFEKTKTGQLTAEVSQYNGDMIIINQEKNDAIEEEGRTRETLQFAEDTNRELQLENEKLSTVIQEVRKDLVASKSAEQKLTSKCTGLRNQVNALQDAKVAGDRQLRQEQHDSQTQLQQAETNKIASLADLKSSLKLSEDARKELQAKLRQKEAAHKEQIEHHQQTTNTKFEDLAAQSHQKQEKLKAKLRQEMEKCEQDAEARVADTRRETKRLVNEAETRKAEMAAEAERRLKEAGISATRILVPNTQQSEQNGTPSSQQSHSERTRKKVDRQTNSVTVVASSSRRPLGSAQGHSFLNSAAISDRRQEGSENEMGYFEQEYESRFGSQVLSQHQETQPSILDSGVETVPETQHFEYDQGVAAQLKILESQVIASDNADQENLTDLSTIPSEDLSEMLMDIHPRSQQHRHTPKHASSSSREFGTPGQSAHDKTPDAHLTNSRCRPKSRANTASRMMPLRQPDGQHRRTHAEHGPGHVSHTRAERSLTADDNDFPDFMHSNNTVAKRTSDHHSGHDADSGQKRKAPGNADDSGSFKKLRTSARAFAQRPGSISKSYAPYMPPPTKTSAQNNSDPDPGPASVTNRRSSYRQSSTAGSRSIAPRVSSTRNTRSKGL